MVVCDNDDDVLFLGEKQYKRRAHKNTGDTYKMMMTLKKKKRRRRREREGASSSFRIMIISLARRVSFLVFSPCRFHPFFEIVNFFDSSDSTETSRLLSFW
jgi:hypothetical protein